MAYKLGKRQRVNFMDERGHAVPGYRVFFTMEDGTVDFVEVEKNLYNAENVKAAIEEAIANHEDVIAS